MSAEIDIVHADEAIVVLNKPSGLLSVPGRGPDKQDCLSARVQQRFADALIVHRLDMCTSGLSQMVALRALQRDIPGRILPQILATYRARRDALCAAMHEHLGAHLEWQHPSGGMFVWARARDPRLDSDRLLHRALAHGVCISPSSVFDPEGLDRGAMRLNFTLNPPDRLEEGVRRLAAAIHATLEEG